MHTVHLGPFAMSRTAVTNQEYRMFLEATGHSSPPMVSSPGFDDPRQPVVSVAWRDAMAYCEWLSAETGQSFRLPTEAEWEKAARGGREGLSYPWGNDPPEKNLFAPLVRRLQGPLSVASTPPNSFGLYEMCLNVHEWCADWYDPSFYTRSPRENPVNQVPTGQRASRGGSWRHEHNYSRVSARSSIPPDFQYADYGFRLAFSLG